jgi:group I intron endonuclease
MEELQNEEIIEKPTDEDMRWCVYMHTNKENGKVYIGVTCRQPEVRWGKNGSEYKRLNQRAFAGAIAKYTWDGFTHEVLFTDLTKDEANQKEIELIALYKANVCRWGKEAMGYNMTDGGEGHLGHKHGKRTRQKMSESAKNRCTDEWKRQQSIRMKGRFVGEKSPNYGKQVSDETRQKISDTRVKKPVVQLTLDGDYIAEFDGLLDAEKQTSVSHSEIGKCCKGKCQSAGGFLWVSKTLYNEEFDYSYSNQHMIPVMQFDLNGKFISSYISAAEAERQTSTCGNNILRCCRNELKSANNYLWRFKATYRNGEAVEYIRDDVRPIVQIDKNGNMVSEYKCISDAARLFDVSVNSIVACCKKKIHSCKGFMWLYKEDYNPNETIIYNGIDVFTPVIQLDLDGNFIAEYPTAAEASRCSGIARRNISACCCGDQKSASGFMWVKKVDYDPNRKYIYTHNKKSAVVQLTLSDEYIQTYESSRSAERETGAHHNEILLCCKGKQKSSRGFHWVYKEDYENNLKK